MTLGAEEALESRVLDLPPHFHMAVQIGETQYFKLLKNSKHFLTC
jgi:hypothetical protein